MQIQGTITRAYFGEGLSGSNGRFNGKNVIHVLPSDPEVMRELDGNHQTGAGEIRIAVPDGELPEVGTEITVDVDETKATLEVKGAPAAPRRRGGGGGGAAGGGETT